MILSPGIVRAALSDALAASLDGLLPEGTPRRVHGAVRMPGKVTAVLGVRRAGKTTFVHQLRRERLAAGTARALLPYVNFEDERLAGLEGNQLGLLLEEYGRRVPDAGRLGTVLWCFDEIQVVPGWERFVRRLLDSKSAEVIVAGSSAALLSREIRTALRGRAWSVILFPFSFPEALAHQGEPVPADPALVTSAERNRLEHAFLQWLETGGFLEAQGLDAATRRQLLRDYVDVAILRDVVERHGVTNIAGLRWLVRHLLVNAAGAFSVEKFHRTLKSQGIAVSRDTLHHLLAYLEDCFLVRTVWMEADSERQRMVNPRKIYPVDAGLIPLFDRSGRANLGHALETAVLIELERRRCEVTYVRTPEGYEVDFLARAPDGIEHLIQVCADASDPETAEREIRALREAGRRRRKARRWLLTLTRDRLPPAPPADIACQTAYQWMLAGEAAAA
ncbi:ATP-binding protein [Pelomicrobium methylotrophicum]|uniref:ATP-binding protein n=1 Tax=Pelomicrobium methylotrophicum TaxID=2602750 RepID=A0A5C7EK44_9PROT|nr:ATP-binding protein [Pelomicrobium methylotrophicum]TXF12898.1 ATP-binding protein [Pelomicrobium methylotrophicum]